MSSPSDPRGGMPDSPASSSAPSSQSAEKVSKGLMGAFSQAFNEMKTTGSHISSQIGTKMEGVEQKVRSELLEAEKEWKQKAAKLEEEINRKTSELQVEYAQKLIAAEHKSRELEGNFREKAKELEKKADEKLSSMKAAIEAEYEEKRKAAVARLTAEFEKRFLIFLDEKLLPEIQLAALDDSMPFFIKRVVVQTIAALWPDIKQEIWSIYEDALLKYEDIPEGENPGCCPNPCKAISAFLLYGMQPYNKTFWARLYTLSYWVVFLVQIFPIYAVQPLWFILQFILIDKSDEYQLIRFILSFKGLQFVTLGVINSIIGAAQYVHCVNFDNRHFYVPKDTTVLADINTARNYNLTSFYDQGGLPLTEIWAHSCREAGPATMPIFYIDMIAFGVQILFIWGAFGLLPYSRKKGLKKLAADSPPRLFALSEDAEDVQDPGRIKKNGCGCRVYDKMGGHLTTLVYLDAVFFFIIVILGIIALFTRSYDVRTNGTGGSNFREYEWQFRADLFWLKTLYGFLSFPFLVLLMPGISGVLLHAKPTGYNRAGQCVPLAIRKGIISEEEWLRLLPAEQRQRELEKKAKAQDSSTWAVKRRIQSLVTDVTDATAEAKTQANYQQHKPVKSNQVVPYTDNKQTNLPNQTDNKV